MWVWLERVRESVRWAVTPLGGVDYRLRVAPVKCGRMLGASLRGDFKPDPRRPGWSVCGWASSKSFSLSVADRPYERGHQRPAVSLSGFIAPDPAGCRLSGRFSRRESGLGGVALVAAVGLGFFVFAVAIDAAGVGAGVAALTIAGVALQLAEAVDDHRQGELERQIIVGRLHDLFDEYLVEGRFGVAVDPGGFEVLMGTSDGGQRG